MAAAQWIWGALMVSYIIYYNNTLEPFAVVQNIYNDFNNKYKHHLNTF